MGNPVSFASCSLMCLVGLGVWLNAVLSTSSCLALMVVLGPLLLLAPVPSSMSLPGPPPPPPPPPQRFLFSDSSEGGGRRRNSLKIAEGRKGRRISTPPLSHETTHTQPGTQKDIFQYAFNQLRRGRQEGKKRQEEEGKREKIN